MSNSNKEYIAEFVKNLGEIIDKGSDDILALSALAFIVLSIVLMWLFRKSESQIINLLGFSILLIGVMGSLWKLYTLNEEVIAEKQEKIVNELQITQTSEIPAIIGIYPSDNFGIDQKEGLIKAVDECPVSIRIIHIDNFTTKELKSVAINEQMNDTISYLISKHNIAGIVGPSITEISDNIINTVKDLESKIPVFILSAASDNFLDWSNMREYVNLYRIGSSISYRANDFGRIMNEATHIGKVAMLVEKDFRGSKTFGEHFYHELKKIDLIKKNIDSGIIHKEYYDTDNKMDGNTIDDKFGKIRDEIKADYVFVLGVGKEVKEIIDEHYTVKSDSNNIELPKYGGWMHAYMLNNNVDRIDTTVYVNNKIFEITDINLNKAVGSSMTGIFNIKFGEIHPGLRDIALTYDAGTILIEAISKFYQKKEISRNNSIIFSNDINQYISEEIIDKENYSLIVMNSKFVNGQNPNLELQLGVYNSSSNSWDNITAKEFWND